MLAAVAVAVLPAAAHAGTYTLRPDGTVLGDWAATPSGAAEWDVLDDAVDQPGAPSTATDYLSSSGIGASLVQVSLSTVPLPADQTVTAATAWAYVAPGAGRSVVLLAGDGGDVVGAAPIPPGSPAGWYSVSIPAPLDQSQVDSLTITVSDVGASDASFVYAAYAQLDTVDTPPPPVIPPVDPTDGDPVTIDPGLLDPPPVVVPPVDPPPVDLPPVDLPIGPGADSPPTDSSAGDPPSDPGTAPAAPAPPSRGGLSVIGARVRATRKGAVPVTIACAAGAAAGCKGKLVLERTTGGTGQQRVGSKRYRLKAGQTKIVAVRMGVRSYRKLRKKRSFRIQVAAQLNDAAGGVTTLRHKVRVYTPKTKKRR